jgi:hypothetical protein
MHRHKSVFPTGWPWSLLEQSIVNSVQQYVGCDAFYFLCLELHMETWHEPEKMSNQWDSKIWLWGLSDLLQRLTAKPITEPSSHQIGCSTLESNNFQIKRWKGKIWSWAPKESPTPRYTGPLTAGSNITLTLKIGAQDMTLEFWRASIGTAPDRTVGSRYQRFWCSACVLNCTVLHTELVCRL